MAENKFKDFIETSKAVAAAFIGVRSDKKRKHDFSQGKASYFIVTGIIAVLFFVFVLIAIVSLIVP